MSRSRILVMLLIGVVALKSCSSLRQNDPNEKVMAFINDFRSNLSATDDIIKAQFQVSAVANVSEDGIMRAIRIMQNADQAKDSITCIINFDAPSITQESGDTRVDFTAQFSSIDPNNILQQQAQFTLWLSNIQGKLVITNIDAMNFYNEYNGAVFQLQSLKNRERDLASRKIFFDQARMLQETYDTVIWYTQYNDSVYYYVVNGEWENFFMGDNRERSNNAKMGLVSESGRVIVPPAYDLVGTISFETENVVEVKKDNLVGHFSMDGKEIAPAVYEWIIPYEQDGVYALVKKDSEIGWLDNNYTHHTGFPSDEAKKYIHEFGYLGKNIEISYTAMPTAEVIHVDYMGRGIVVPPTYFVQAGVLDEVISDIYTGENSFGWGGIEKIETEGSMFEKISDKFSALLVMLNDHYLEGREGFYQRTNLTFVDDQHQLTTSFTMPSGTISFNRIDSTLMEVRLSREGKPADYEYSEMDEDDWFAPYYKYFRLQDGTISALESRRNYAFTQFVKIDSSYLEGTFSTWDEETQGIKTQNFPFNSTLELMRDEILAEYQYEFPDAETRENFRYREWYVPRYSHYSDFYDSMSEIDKHNLQFLERIIGTLDVKQPS
ncbi:MAG TPA: WG repeat-containing protein [Cyclobacteriaceae bacterium]|nr:YARHG domain-containing protein [Cyclobacteriaceae bacterium]HMV10127.1 WG repeat-containing protein [Cyclobacteriaceae bacterium]HMV90355.1 WG repeat-containing protein [Cyclobacteriaceae bacterium]HMX00558.1 WG repeat-containing protein [Cyclobacteriaceae bacterium]HMX49567.1 WG repeat-containing protein [Cyclobacteriaceae bacterium]